MAQTPEAAVKAAVKRILDAHNVYYFPPATGGYGRSGVPDIVCCVKGYFLAIECKAGNDKTTVLQDRELQAIRDARGVAIVVNEDNLEFLVGLLTVIKDLP